MTSECLREQQSQQPDNQPDDLPSGKYNKCKRARELGVRRELGEVNVARVESSTTEDAPVRDSIERTKNCTTYSARLIAEG